jgi:mannan endo-1,4-beta-mannosidase
MFIFRKICYNHTRKNKGRGNGVLDFIRRHKKGVLIGLAACILAGAGALYWLRTSKSDFAAGFRQFVKEHIYSVGFPKRPDLKKGLDISGETVYVDGMRGLLPDNVSGHDVKVVYETPDGMVFCDYANGFSVSLPADMAPDIRNSPKTVSFESNNAKLVVSREWSWDKDVRTLLGEHFYRCLLDESYRANNGIELLESAKTKDYDLLTVRLNGYAGKYDTYTYLDIMTGSRIFYHAMLKYSSADPDAENLITRVLKSFRCFAPEGEARYSVSFRPELPMNWTPETRELYNQITASDDIAWGIFTRDVTGNGITRAIPEIEAKLCYRFGIILAYTCLSDAFPSDFMERCHSEGRIVELTLQTSEGYTPTLFDSSPWLRLYKTGDDARIREFARAAASFGKPFLFRLNNEMNSDWVNYGGVANLLDPDIFVQNWRTVYRIFQEEGVDNAIWIYNPNDRDAPPNSWNNKAAYYPGDDYVQLFGVTGYNNGTYYKELWNENWREFEEIYDRIEEESSALFGKFPWIITEFSSSSVGGDKVRWIEGMFKALPKYKNIKAAVWFSYADFDIRDGVTPARPYWLDETEETLAAFKRGLEGG